MALPRLESMARRLAAARHEATIDDRLDAPPHLLRFELVPWAGPFEASDPSRSAMLEIGLDAATSTRISAWYWLDPGEAPDVVSVPADSLSKQWIDRVILDFVRKVLSGR